MRKRINRQPIKVLHVISGLESGGAEKMLLRLALCSNMNSTSYHILSLSGYGALGKDFISAGIPLYTISMKQHRISWRDIVAMGKIMKMVDPDVVQTWMFHADFIGGLIARFWLNKPVVWNLRQSDTLDDKLIKKLLANVVNRVLSYFVPKVIVCCGMHVKNLYQSKGYCSKKLIVIPNGYDTSSFCIDPKRRFSVRTSRALLDSHIVIGVVGRFHPMKDHLNFVRAAQIVSDTLSEARFVFCGNGLDDKNKELMGWIDSVGLPKDRCIFLGEQAIMREVYPMLDLLVSSSRSGEGFPNVIAEAMASGVPCVATDIGGSAEVIGREDLIVPPSRSDLLADAIIKIVNLNPEERKALVQEARARIVDKYSITSACLSYESLYDKLSFNN